MFFISTNSNGFLKPDVIVTIIFALVEHQIPNVAKILAEYNFEALRSKLANVYINLFRFSFLESLKLAHDPLILAPYLADDYLIAGTTLGPDLHYDIFEISFF
jgi:hypothetical protein